MLHEHRVSPLAIDLTRIHPRTVTSFYSNLVTRPTGQAVRMGVESQLAELPAGRAVCLSILDFSQVCVVDYSCADEIVAKLLLRYGGEDRPGDVYFLVRGIQEHHEEAIEAVLEHHRLAVCAEDGRGRPRLLGSCTAVQRSCWDVVARAGRVSGPAVAGACALAEDTALRALATLAAHRVVVPLLGGDFACITTLAPASDG